MAVFLPASRLRRVLLLACVLGVAAAAIGGRWLGGWLVREDPLTHADAIYMLAGSVADRAVEAGDLYLAGWAPLIVLSAEGFDGGELELHRRGIAVTSRPERQKETLVRMGVPAAAILIPTSTHRSTSDEESTLRTLVHERAWRTVIVVTSKMHTRRAGLIMRRSMRTTGVRIVMRASRFDVADPAHWWRDRNDLRFVLFESQKVLAYALGVD